MGGCDQSMLLARALLGDGGPLRIIAIARPGYPGTPLTVGATPEAQADLIAALLDELGVAEAVLAAVSAGGPCAIQFAARHPERCRALILVSACSGQLATPDHAKQRMKTMSRLARIPGLAMLLRLRLAAAPGKGTERAVPDPALRAQTLADPAAATLLQTMQLSIFSRLAERMPGTLNDTDLFSAMPALPLAKVRAPVMVVHAEDDPVVPFAHATVVASDVPGAQLMRIAQGGHVCLFTHVHEIRRRVAAFLSGVAQADGRAPSQRRNGQPA